MTFRGKPVVWGSVTLKAADGSIHQIGINLDGTYRLERVPVGPAGVGVSSPDPAPSARAPHSAATSYGAGLVRRPCRPAPGSHCRTSMATRPHPG